jgi:hypothetical protein
MHKVDGDLTTCLWPLARRHSFTKFESFDNVINLRNLINDLYKMVSSIVSDSTA